MKTSQLAATSALTIAISTLTSASALAAGEPASAIPSVPIGTLSAFPTIVQTGTKPTLTWNILYPSTVSDVATINPPGTITLTQDNIYVSVQPIGTGITACDASQGTTQVPTEARMSVNGSNFFQLFYGTQSDVAPAYSLYTKKLGKGTTINFGGRYLKTGGWSPLYTTRSTNLQVITLKDGDIPPTTFSLYQSPRLAPYLSPYLDASGKIRVGPLSVIVLMELGQTNHSLPCFDYQDMALLVTFATKHPNNGHGNNLDGVDVSNPGQGHGGPNGEVDPSGGFDDEGKVNPN